MKQIFNEMRKFSVFVILLMLSTGLINSIASVEFGCPTESCYCPEILNASNIYEMKCPADNPTIQIRFESNNNLSLHINCESDEDPFMYETVIPKLNTSNVKSVTYTNCVLPENGSLQQGMNDLDQLEFVNMKLSAIGPFKHQHFSGLENLKRMEISANTTHELPDGIFDHMEKLESVIVYAYKFNVKILENLSEITDFMIGSNITWSGIEFDTDSFKKLSKLRKAAIVGSKLPQITKRSLEGISKIEVLMFAQDDIDGFDSDAFSQLKDLQAIAFFDNHLSSLPNGIFQQNKNLTKVVLAGENFKTLPEGLLMDLPLLQLVTFKDCKFSSLPPDTFKDSSNIEVIAIKNTLLTTLPSGIFDSLVTLKSLDMRRNLLSTLPGDLFAKLESLTYLDLGGNKFKQIADAIPIKLMSLRKLSLNGNLIEDISVADLKLIENSGEVRLIGNLIGTVSAADYFNEIANTHSYNGTFYIGWNPFDCSCSVRSFIQLIQNPQSRSLFNMECLRCATPENMNNRFVNKLSVNDLNCAV